MESLQDTPISAAAVRYLKSISVAHSPNTTRTYGNAIALFLGVLEQHGVNDHVTLVSHLKEDAITWLTAYLETLSPATERLYLHAVTGFYEYMSAEGLSEVNLSRLRVLVRQGKRHHGGRMPPHLRVDFMEHILDLVGAIVNLAPAAHLRPSQNELLRALRDRAFLLTLADTGLRVHEACALLRGDVNWNEGRAVISGGGQREAVIRFSTRSINALREYLAARAELDASTGRHQASQPLFARHDKGAGKKVKPITTTTGRNIVHERVRQALGEEAEGRITPHSFRHYFVTTVLRGSGNLKMAQELARHKNIQVTQRYAHLSDDELDKGYYEIFEKDKS